MNRRGNGAVVWFTGLPASGKSTLAAAIAERLRVLGREPLILDSDVVRAAVAADGHDAAERDRFYRALGALANAAAGQGLIVLVPATAHRQAWRDAARAAAPRFVEVYLATSLAACRRRDPKGLYAAAGLGSTLPGVGVAYEPPPAPEVVIDGSDRGDRAAAVEAVLAALAAVTRVGARAPPPP